jgi:protein involved in plasmid replication-relaxation
MRDIEIFKLLERYRYLRSTYLHALVGGTSVTRFLERLGDLFHEGYLDRPERQWEFADARCAPVVYERGKGSLSALRSSGSPVDGSSTFLADTAHRQFQHSLLICEALASLELAARAAPHLRFIPWPEIAARMPEAARASAMPFRLLVSSGGYLVPDGVFGIEYRDGEAKTYRFFALEADRGTMPIARSDPKQTSYLGKLASYREVLARQVHKTQWGVPNLLVLTVTTSPARLSEMIGRLEGGTASPAFLFKALDGRTLSRPARGLLCEPWERVHQAAMSIARIEG